MSFFHPRFRSLLSSALVLGTLALGPVSAQTFDLDFNMLMMQSTFQGINQYNQMDTIIHDTQARDARNGIYYPANEHLRGTQAPSRPAINTTITYQTAISDEAKRQYISRIRKAHGDRIADAFLAEFTRQNVRSAFREQTRAYGLRDDRYEDVFSAYILTMWMIANKTNPPSADQVQAVARQALDIFNTSGLPQDPRERQLAAEMMMYELVSALYGRDESLRVNDTATLQRMSEIAQNNFLKSGMDFRNMTITSAGLVRKS